MCGILGLFGDVKDYRKSLAVMQNRGRDSCGVYDGRNISFASIPNKLPELQSETILAHLLHSVVSCVSQPIKREGVLVANCEIYNWKELNEKHSLSAQNDTELLLYLIEKKGVENILEVLDELDGVYAFSYWKDDHVYLCRDLLGVKPIWYSTTKGFYFASERKALHALDIVDVKELNPRTVLKYSLGSRDIVEEKREFFSLGNRAVDEEHVEKLLIDAVSKRIPDRPFGILLSGGIDSTFLAYACKKLGKEFTCYTAVLSEKGMGEAEDLSYAKKVADLLGIELKVQTLSVAEVESYLARVVPLIEDNNVVKVGVGLTFYAACELALQDGVKVLFSGLGSEEIFAGYDRHTRALDINKECLAGLLKMYERDLYRDDVITMNQAIELRLPFLDKALVSYALNIPSEKKISDGRNKIILREIARRMGVPEEFAERKKKAAQYGSKFDRAILKLAKKEGKKKSEYLKKFYQPPNVKLGVLWSSGKDSAYAAYTMVKQNYEISCLISLKSSNPDSYMFHTPAIDLVSLQAESMGVPLILQETTGEKEKELDDLFSALKKAKEEYRIEGVVTGALYSTYQRDRIERICDSLSLKIFSPLWHIDQEFEMRSLLLEGFSIMFSAVGAEGLDKSWLGREITPQDVDTLVLLNKKIGLNIAGEGGEFESLVLDCPLFSKRLSIENEVLSDGEHSARLIVQGAKLV